MKTVISLILFSLLSFSWTSYASEEEILKQEGELIIKFKSQVQSGEEDILKVLVDVINFHHLKDTLEEEKEVKVLNAYAWANIYHVQIPEGETLEHMIKEIQKLDDVEYVEPNYLFHVDASTEAMDYQVASAKPSSGTQSNLDASQVLASGGQSVTVAVIDTGVDYTHKDIAPYMWVNSGEIPGNGMDDDGNGYVDDINGYDFVNNDSDPYDDHYHGTHVSGIILSRQDSAHPVIKIMALKFLDKGGYGSTGDAIRAIDYAIKNGAKILNNSWGGGPYSQALRDSIIATYNANRIFVVAAGNSAVNVDQYASYPPSYLIPNMIAVAALDSATNLAWFSNYGPTSVHVGAPGVSIYSTLPNQKYGYLSGTSMATPYVSGVAAMMLSKQPELMHLQVKKIIMDTSVSNASLEGYIGKGSVEPEDAVTVASSTTPDTHIPAYTPASVPPSFGSVAQRSGQSAGMGCGMISELYANDDDHFNSSSGVSLFFLAWPLLFVVMLRTLLLNQRRKFVFHKF